MKIAFLFGGLAGILLSAVMIGGMKSFLIASIFVQPIIIGIIAQKGFGRIGVVWALIAFALNLASGFFS